MHKRCTQCGETKSLDLFSNWSKGKLGKKSHCKECGARATRLWVKNNKDKKHAADVAYYAKNHQHIKDRIQVWRKEHPNYTFDYRATHLEQHAKHAKVYRLRHPVRAKNASITAKKKRPGYINSCSAARRARILQATPAWADLDAIRAIYADAARLTQETGIKHHVDHIYPLKSPLVCGLHVENNLQILLEKENLIKSNLIQMV